MAAAVAIVVAVTACGEQGDGAASGLGADLDGRTFLSESIEGHTIVPGTQIRIDVDGADLTATAGCNTLGGRFSFAGDVLVIAEGMSMTEMGCDPARHAQDTWLVELLQGRPRVTLDGDRLVISGDAGTVRLVDRVVADPDRPLAGTTWTVDTIVSGDAASSVPEGSVVTLLLGVDGRLTVTSDGCSSIDLAVEVDDAAGTLRVTGVPGDTADCPSPWTETLDVFRAGDVDYRITATRLTLSAGEQGVAAMADQG